MLGIKPPSVGKSQEFEELSKISAAAKEGDTGRSQTGYTKKR